MPSQKKCSKIKDPALRRQCESYQGKFATKKPTTKAQVLNKRKSGY